MIDEKVIQKKRTELANKIKQILSNSKPDDEITVTVVVSRDGCHSLVQILKGLKYLGDVGASREVVIDPDGDDTEIFGWDGDGSAHIYSILVNGEKIK